MEIWSRMSLLARIEVVIGFLSRDRSQSRTRMRREASFSSEHITQVWTIDSHSTCFHTLLEFPFTTVTSREEGGLNDVRVLVLKRTRLEIDSHILESESDMHVSQIGVFDLNALSLH